MININDLSSWALANAETDKNKLEMCLQAAVSYFDGAGVPQLVYDGNKLYEVGVYMLATHWFDNGVPVQQGGAAETPLTVSSILNQLKYRDGDSS